MQYNFKQGSAIYEYNYIEDLVVDKVQTIRCRNIDTNADNFLAKVYFWLS